MQELEREFLKRQALLEQQATVNGASSADDPVNPQHYKTGTVECIDAIEAALGREGFVAFLRGQVIKYIWRGPHKANHLQDAQKASWYLDRLIDLLKTPPQG